MESSSDSDNWLVPSKEFLEEYRRLNLPDDAREAFLELLQLIGRMASRQLGPFTLLPGVPLSHWEVPLRAQLELYRSVQRNPRTIRVLPRSKRLPGTNSAFIYLASEAKVYLLGIEPLEVKVEDDRIVGDPAKMAKGLRYRVELKGRRWWVENVDGHTIRYYRGPKV